MCFFFFYLPHCCASRQPITGVEFKFVARQVVASVVIRAAKLIFFAKSRTRVFFAQSVASTYNTVFAARQVGHKRGNTRNNVFQLAIQQCCETIRKKMLPVLLDLNEHLVICWDLYTRPVRYVMLAQKRDIKVGEL